MPTDRFGGRLSSANVNAVAGYGYAVLGFVSHRHTLTAAMQRVVPADPDFIAA